MRRNTRVHVSQANVTGYPRTGSLARPRHRLGCTATLPPGIRSCSRPVRKERAFGDFLRGWRHRATWPVTSAHFTLMPHLEPCCCRRPRSPSQDSVRRLGPRRERWCWKAIAEDYLALCPNGFVRDPHPGPFDVRRAKSPVREAWSLNTSTSPPHPGEGPHRFRRRRSGKASCIARGHCGSWLGWDGG